MLCECKIKGTFRNYRLLHVLHGGSLQYHHVVCLEEDMELKSMHTYASVASLENDSSHSNLRASKQKKLQTGAQKEHSTTTCKKVHLLQLIACMPEIYRQAKK